MSKLTYAKYLDQHRIFVLFDDGVQGVIDFLPRLRTQSGLAQDLLSVAQFKQFMLDPAWSTLVWRNGWDIAPEVLYDLVTVPQHAT